MNRSVRLKSALGSQLVIAVITILCFFGSVSNAAPLVGRIVLDKSNLPTFDPSTFGPGPNIDVHHVVLTNENDEPVTSLSLRLVGDFLDRPQAGKYRRSAILTLTGVNEIADSFFVTPASFLPPVMEPPGPPGVLSGGFSISAEDQGDYLPGGGSTIVAVLSVPTGTPISTVGWFGSATVQGLDAMVLFVPEPTTVWMTTALLIGLFGSLRNSHPQRK